jgi:hypothetical protein
LLFALFSTAVAEDAGNSEKRPFDLIDDLGRDTNNFPRNPRWHGGRPDSAAECNSFPARWFKKADPDLKCTNDPVYVDQRDGSIICGRNKKIEGHVNWGPATFDGCIRRYKSHMDGDVTWDLETRDCRIITEQTKRSTLHCEAESARTVERFDTSWWEGFRKEPHQTVDRYAVISGLLNLDNVHQAYSELHPIYAFAVMEKEQCENGRCTETWAFFVRNWGDQGYCSTKADHEILNLDRVACGESECVLMRIDIPLRGGTLPEVTPIEKIKSRGADGAPNPRWEENGEYVTLEFALPRLVRTEGIYFGALALEVTRFADYDPRDTCATRQTCPPGVVGFEAFRAAEPCTYESIHEYLTEGVERTPPMETLVRVSPPSPSVEVSLTRGRFTPSYTSTKKPMTGLADPGLGAAIDEFTCSGVNRRRKDLGNTEKVDGCYPKKRLLKKHIKKMWKKCKKSGFT